MVSFQKAQIVFFQSIICKRFKPSSNLQNQISSFPQNGAGIPIWRWCSVPQNRDRVLSQKRGTGHPPGKDEYESRSWQKVLKTKQADKPSKRQMCWRETAAIHLKRSRKERQNAEGFWQVVTKRRAGRIRKEGGSGQWQTLKIPFITGRPGLAETNWTTSRAAGHNLYRSRHNDELVQKLDQNAIPGPVKKDSFDID